MTDWKLICNLEDIPQLGSRVVHWEERGKIVEDEEGRKALYAALLDSLKNAKDPWATSREPEAIKQFIPITVEA